MVVTIFVSTINNATCNNNNNNINNNNNNNNNHNNHLIFFIKFFWYLYYLYFFPFSFNFVLQRFLGISPSQKVIDLSCTINTKRVTFHSFLCYPLQSPPNIPKPHENPTRLNNPFPFFKKKIKKQIGATSIMIDFAVNIIIVCAAAVPSASSLPVPWAS